MTRVNNVIRLNPTSVWMDDCLKRTSMWRILIGFCRRHSQEAVMRLLSSEEAMRLRDAGWKGFGGLCGGTQGLRKG